jgi:leucyl aminopeptidase (aminopeptidase T)
MAAKSCLRNVMEVKENENLIIIVDDSLKDLGKIFEAGAKGLGLNANLIVLDDTKIRKEAPSDFIQFLQETQVDIFINILRGMTEETPFRIGIVSTEKDRRVRLGHCPGLTRDMFIEGALAMDDDDYKVMNKLADDLLERCEGAERVKVTCPGGTDLEMDVKGRDFFPDIRVDWESMKWMNLPVGEVMAGPVETSLEGTLLCKHSIGGIGILDRPVRIEASKGRAENVSGDPEVVKRVENALDTDEWSRNVGEFAMGINHKARFVQEFLETEKIAGTSHIAFGANMDFPGGKNNSTNHMDFLITEPSVTIFGEKGEMEILKRGKFVF